MTEPGRASDPFPFALGHARSGTTMLRAMLDSHPALAVPPESYFVIPALAASVISRGSFDFQGFVTRVRNDRYFADWGLADAELEALGQDLRVQSTADAIAGLYAAYARVHGKTRYADKTPSHLLDVDLLASQFPTSQFVHLVRDGRDVVASVLTMDFGPADFANAVYSWRLRVLRAHRAGLSLGNDRYHLIHYEDLVDEPDTVLRQVCEWFELPYEPSMLRYHERADDLLEGLRHTAHLQGIRRPPTAGIRNWRVDLTPHQIQVFDEIAGDTLELLGYERSGLARSWRARATAAETRVHRESRRVWRKAKRRVRAVYRRVRA